MTAASHATTTLNFYTVRIGSEVRNIDGTSALEALATLSAEDRARAVLLFDDSDLIFESTTRPAKVPSARLIAASRAKSRFRPFAVAAAIALKLWPIWLVAIAFAFFASGQATHGMAKYVLLCVALVVAWIVWRIVSYQRRANAIYRASARKDWQGVLAAVDRAAAPLAPVASDIFERSAAQYRIRALIALNRDEVARALIERHATDPNTRPEAILYMRAVYHRVRGEVDAELEAYRQITVERPLASFAWMTYAEKLALDHGRAADAREALEHAKTLPLAENKQWQIDSIEGIVRQSEGRDEDAIESFTAARTISPDSFTHKASMLSVAPGTAAACMAIAHARLNHSADAIRELEGAFSMLSHHPRGDLLERAQREVAACEQRASARP